MGSTRSRDALGTIADNSRLVSAWASLESLVRFQICNWLPDVLHIQTVIRHSVLVDGHMQPKTSCTTGAQNHFLYLK